MSKKLYFWLLIIAGLFYLTGCGKEQVLKVEPKLNDISFSILNSYGTEIDQSIPNLNDKDEEQYSAYMNQRVLMIIEIDNPDNYEITSIVINEVEIDEFDSASSNSIIIYQVDTSNYGLKEFIISKINYKNEEEIFGVNITENNKMYLDVFIDIEEKVLISSRHITSSSFSFDVNISYNNQYIDQNEILFKAVLFDGDVVVQEIIISETNMTINFPNLERIKQYHYEVVAKYGNAEFLLYNETFQTFDQISVQDISSTRDSISFQIIKDSNITIKKLQIYKGNSLISNLYNFEETIFRNLEKSTKYTIKITYEFNLDDKVIEDDYSFEYATLGAHIEILSMSLNRRTINIGDEVEVSLWVNNIDKIFIKAVVIAGVRVDVTNGEFMEFSFVPKSSTGVLNVKVDKIIYEVDGIEVYQTGNTYSVDLNIIHIEVLDIYNENDNIVAEDGKNDLIIKFNNPNAYIIKELSLKIDDGIYSYTEEEITVIDDHHIKVPWRSRTSFDENKVFQDVELSMIKLAGKEDEYSYYYGYKNTVYKFKSTFSILNSSETKEINNLDQLLNIESGYKYKLMTDIDLTGHEWNPLTFSGIFDGNNHTINNLYILSNNPLENTSVGMFQKFNGILKNLNLNSANIIVRAKDTYVGGLIGEGSFNLVNCTFQGKIDIISEIAYVGGLVGKSENSNFLYNTANANIIVVGNNEYYNVSGGIVGSSIYSNLNYNISNTNIDAKKFKSYSVGGIVGDSRNYGNNKGTISNNIIGDCIINVDKEVEYGSISSIGGIAGYSDTNYIYNNLILCRLNYSGTQFNYGGIVGKANFSNVYNNLLAKKDISIINYKSQNNHIDLFVGDSLNVVSYNNYITYNKNYLVYRTSNEYYLKKTNVNLVDDKKLNLSSFYIDELNWEDNVWDLESLDYQNGIYPVLRRKGEVK